VWTSPDQRQAHFVQPIPCVPARTFVFAGLLVRAHVVHPRLFSLSHSGYRDASARAQSSGKSSAKTVRAAYIQRTFVRQVAVAPVKLLPKVGNVIVGETGLPQAVEPDVRYHPILRWWLVANRRQEEQLQVSTF